MFRLFAILSVLCAPLVADDYYVDVQNGSDSSGDGGQSSPWSTISHASSQVLANTDVIHVLPGIYGTTSGETFPITLATGVDLISEAGREATLITGDGTSPVFFLSNAVSAHENRIDGFTIRNGRDGIQVDPPGKTLVAVIANSTITSNVRAGLYTGSSTGLISVLVERSKVSRNQMGWLHMGANAGSNCALVSTEVYSNGAEGVTIAGSNGLQNFNTKDTVIRGNGGVGWTQVASQYGGVQSNWVNTTISGNSGGGVRTHADAWQDYIPYYGYFWVDPVVSINPYFSVIHGNAGFGGALQSGTSFSSYGLLGASISWGNIGLDNQNMTTAGSNVGTGDRTGADTISADPRWVDPQGGDYRLHFDSPCVELIGDNSIRTEDFEGESRPFDGDSDGSLRRDIGIDEFHFFVAPGTAPVAGQAFHFIAEAPPAESGRLALVLISRNDGGGTGIPLPGGQGLTVDLAPDNLFTLGLSLLSVLQTTLTAQQGQTPPVQIPLGTTGIEIHYAGITFDTASFTFGSVSPTHSFVIQ